MKMKTKHLTTSGLEFIISEKFNVGIEYNRIKSGYHWVAYWECWDMEYTEFRYPDVNKLNRPKGYYRKDNAPWDLAKKMKFFPRFEQYQGWANAYRAGLLWIGEQLGLEYEDGHGWKQLVRDGHVEVTKGSLDCSLNNNRVYQRVRRKLIEEGVLV